jgi:hypothetical protein
MPMSVNGLRRRSRHAWSLTPWLGTTFKDLVHRFLRTRGARRRRPS